MPAVTAFDKPQTVVVVQLEELLNVVLDRLLLVPDKPLAVFARIEADSFAAVDSKSTAIVELVGIAAHSAIVMDILRCERCFQPKKKSSIFLYFSLKIREVFDILTQHVAPVGLKPAVSY